MKLKKYLILPFLLLCYALIMAWIGRANLFNPDTRLTYILSLVFEAIVLVGLTIFLKKRSELRRRRLDEEKKLSSGSD